MDEQTRLELEVKQLKEELKKLHTSHAFGKLDDENIIKEKKRKLFEVSTSLELCKMNNKEDVKRR